jgi:hypothetical protein
MVFRTLVRNVTIFRSILVAALVCLYAYAGFLMLNPRVSQAYMAYYSTAESDLSPTEIRLQKQKAAGDMGAVVAPDGKAEAATSR